MRLVEITLAVALAAPLAAMAQGDMKGMPMKDMDKKPPSAADKAAVTHRTVGVVKKVDPKAATVTLAHEPVKSLNWPAMNMAFKVQDKAMLEKFAVDKRVEVEFQARGKDHVITGVK